MNLRKHQKEILDLNPDRALLCWEMRTGKSLPAMLWAQRRGGTTLIVCPKQLVQDWKTLAPFAIVLSKEQFKKEQPSNVTSLIVDESHHFASALFTRTRSQLASVLYNFIKRQPNMGVWLLSATPIRNDPSSLHTQLCYIGVYIDWKRWRSRFYELKSPPYLKGRSAYFPKDGWQKDIKPVLEKYTHIVSLKDCVDYLPPVTTEVVKIKTPKYVQPPIEERHWTKEHIHEQSNKLSYIKQLGYRKIIISCHYTAQIDYYAKELAKERQVFVLDGRTKNPADVKKQAQESDECYFIVQAGMGYGWEGYMFGALVFTSMSHKALDHTQMLGRTTSVDNPQPLFYYYLIGGKWDQRIYNSIKKNEDFNPHKFNDIP